jgi:Fur family zinc uptake transcriptional regulator
MAHGSPCGHDHHNHGVAGASLAAELEAAEARCVAAEQRLTPPRRRVLELLLQAGQPVKAYDLISTFGGDGPPAKPPTVYRALDFLEKQGFAHRIESLNAYVACRKEADGEIEPQASAEIIAAGVTAGYALTAVTIEAHGLCADCRN